MQVGGGGLERAAAVDGGKGGELGGVEHCRAFAGGERREPARRQWFSDQRRTTGDRRDIHGPMKIREI